MPLIPKRQETVWEEKTFDVLQTHDATGENVFASVFGTAAVIESLVEEARSYSVIHLLTGYRIAWFTDVEDAMQLAEVCWNRARSAMLAKTQKEARKLAPPWLRPWTHECIDADKFTDPIPF